MKSSEKVRVAQLGVGYWGPNLLRNLRNHPGFEVAAVGEYSSARRQFVSDHFPGVPVTDDADGIIANPDIDAVVIATPASTHFDLATRCLSAGKHVMVEKPLATTVEEVDALDRLATARGLVCMAAHTFLYNSAVRYLRKLIESGELGDIRYIYSQRLNLGRIRPDVDALWNLAPHDVSIIQYLLGEPAPVCVERRGMAYVQPDIEDVVFLHIEYPGKVMANVHVSWLDPHKVRQMTIVGSRKMVIYDDVADNKIAIYDKGIEPKAVLGERMDYDSPGRAAASAQFLHRSGDVLIPYINFKEPLSEEISHFRECIVDGIPCLSGAAHARQVVEILASAKTR